MEFRQEFTAFLGASEVDFSEPSPGLLLFPGRDICIRLVPVSGGFDGGVTLPEVPSGLRTIHLYEDRWRREGEIVRLRILAHLGRCRTLFARNCKVKKLDTPEASTFLDLYHSYGSARSRYRYGLLSGEELVAVATFSAGRPMQRDRTVQSYEWVRYASLPDLRVTGGMGKLLQAFIDDVSPEEVMSYADLEWSDGAVYRTLGFVEAGRRAPVEFLVDTDTWQRISIEKLDRDRAFRELEPGPDSRFCRITNLGSIKYLKRITP